ncbi:MAG: HAD family hydrolase [Peptoniphilaceae bacterium]|nr:HAD family hydrolase [Peptoniphilaceae bacterium]
MIQLFCSDFDGTLAQRGRVLPENAKAIRHLIETGTAFSLVTGRPFGNARKLMGAQNIQGHIIASNGAVVMQDGTTLLSARCIPHDALQEIIAYAHEKKWFYVAYTLDESIVPVALPRALFYAVGRLVQHKTGMRIVRERDVAPDGWRITKLNLYPRGIPVQDVFAQWADDSRLYVTVSSQNKIEISAAGVSKWAGIQTLAEALGISASQIATIGDYDNDVPMLEKASLSFAIGDGQPAAKAAAREVVAPVAENGVAEAVYRVMALNEQHAGETR